MISKTIKSMITTVINPFDGLLSRYFVTLDPVLNSYYELAAPKTFTGDFKLEFEFVISDVTSNRVLFSGDAGNYRVYLNGTSGTLTIKYLDNTGTAVYRAISGTNWADGKLHKGYYSRLGSVNTISCEGESDASTSIAAQSVIFDKIGQVGGNSYFYGIIANAKFTDKSGATDVVTTFKLDQATANTEYSQENVFGSEEVVNGDFATNVDGWSAAYQSVLSWDSGKMRVIASGGTNPYVQQTITGLTVGKLYECQGKLGQGTSGSSSIAFFASVSTSLAASDLGSAGGEAPRFSFTATASTVYIKAKHSNTTIGSYFEVDNVSVKEITNAVEYKNIPQSARELYSLKDDTWVGSEELVVNGDFATDSDWDKSGATISSGSANFTGASHQRISQTLLALNTTYKITYTILSSNKTDGLFTARGGSALVVNLPSGVGAHEVISTTANSGVLIFYISATTSGFIGSIDNVSVKEIIEVAS